MPLLVIEALQLGLLNTELPDYAAGQQQDNQGRVGSLHYD